MATEDAVLVSTTPDGITTITLNRPHRRNAVDPATASLLYTAIRSFEDDAAQKICILNGNNGTFCAGFDLHSLASGNYGDGKPSSGLPTYRTDEPAQQGPMGPSRLIVKKPVIAAVSGYAVAGGLELSLIADLRIAEEDTIFGVFCRRFGVPLIDGGTVRLPAIIGLGRALDMILTGRPVTAAEALSMGLANRVVPKGKALEEAEKLARQLLVFPAECMNKDRTSAYHATYNATSWESAMKFEFDEGVKIISEESIKGAARFSAGQGRHGAFQTGNPEGKL
ncbi:Carnitinyl-CoA dehydratase [Drechslerella dactyloides]|uniref:Carnitinyl-CoA dehydratase n=1 Tax=Drechslerella dactyloides TaxID=74499 RepID=A0AAD6NLM1_DREDA|nr:Carnitinyl-CoA dehydratase [Drechslerella dactyloides]